MSERRCVVLDPGHGGTVPAGGSSPNRAAGPNGQLEKDLALDLARRARFHLGDRARIVLTRDDPDTNLSLSARAALARQCDADVFVSIHWNGSPDPGRDGTEAWIARDANPRSEALAEALVRGVSAAAGSPNLGVRRRNLGVLLPDRHSPGTAACLLEVGFLTHPGRARQLEDEAHRETLARVLADSIASRLGGAVTSSLGEPSFVLRASVGEGGVNDGDDVVALKTRLLDLGFSWLVPGRTIDADTLAAIRLFQSIVGGAHAVRGDGRVDVPGPTYRWLQAPNTPRWRLMPEGSVAEGFVNVERADSSDQHDWGTDWVERAIRGAGAHYRDRYLATHPGAALLAVNDVSLPRGGDTPDHAGHETGLACDIRLPRTTGAAGGITWRDASYDRDAMRAQLQALRAQELVRHVFLNDRRLIDEGLCVSVPGHDDHAHFEVRPPALASSTGLGVSRALGLGDGSPLRNQAVRYCWEACQRLRRGAGEARSLNRLSADRIRRETGIGVDANPYVGITEPELDALVRAGYHSHQMPEVLLALWAKEGSSRSVTGAREVPLATTAERARAILRSRIYYEDLGMDHFLVTTRAAGGGDNTFDPSDAAAPGHDRHFATRVRELVDEGLLDEDVTDAVNRELVVSRNAGGRFTVAPSTKFYALSLLLADALFTKFQRQSYPQLAVIPAPLNYLQWNMGATSFRGFLESADRHRREREFLVAGEPIALERWALHTRPKANEWRGARINAIRFLHYVESYRPIFANAITLIKPGIEDLDRGPSRTAATSVLVPAPA